MDAPVELVDIFPTMVDLAGLDQIDVCDKDVEESRKEKACRLISVAINEHIIIKKNHSSRMRTARFSGLGVCETTL